MGGFSRKEMSRLLGIPECFLPNVEFFRPDEDEESYNNCSSKGSSLCEGDCSSCSFYCKIEDKEV